MARMVTMIRGGPISPASATAAPGAPPKREPNTTEKFTTFGPGRNWESANASLNSSDVIQRRCSTIIRRAHGSAPPNPEMETITKARKSSESLGRIVVEEDGAVGADMRRQTTTGRMQRLDSGARANLPCAGDFCAAGRVRA